MSDLNETMNERDRVKLASGELVLSWCLRCCSRTNGATGPSRQSSVLPVINHWVEAQRHKEVVLMFLSWEPIGQRTNLSAHCFSINQSVSKVGLHVLMGLEEIRATSLRFVQLS